MRQFTIGKNDAGQRLDRWLSKAVPLLPAPLMQQYIRIKRVKLNGKGAKRDTRLRQGDLLQLYINDEFFDRPTAENAFLTIPVPRLDIIYEDDDVIVLNKPRGMVVHPAPGHYTGTLVNALLFHCRNLSGINGVIRPGIVHRLDKDTSGIMIVAKNDDAHVSLSKQIQDKTAKRTYLCVVRGNVKADRGLIETRMDRDKNDRKRMAVVTEGGREAITEYEVLERFGRFTVVLCRLKTGRTHQIRLHMEHLGYPLVGDPKYSPMKTPFSIKGQALHSRTLDFIHPRTGQPMHFEAPLPEDMQKILTRLHNGQF